MFALSTSVSMGPSASRAWRNRAATWSGSRTSALMATALPPAAMISCTTEAAASSLWA